MFQTLLAEKPRRCDPAHATCCRPPLVLVRSLARGRIRFFIPALRGNNALKEMIAWGLCRELGVYSFQVSMLTGTVLVRHTSKANVDGLLKVLQKLASERTELERKFQTQGVALTPRVQPILNRIGLRSRFLNFK